jgi:hypothetical protein
MKLGACAEGAPLGKIDRRIRAKQKKKKTKQERAGEMAMEIGLVTFAVLFGRKLGHGG